MAETVIMPKLGFDMAEGTLVRWVIQEGEKVAKGAVLAEIETDKATVEVESNYEGTIAKHLVESGAVVPVSTPIAIIAAPGESVEEAAKSAKAQAGEKRKEDEGEKTRPPLEEEMIAREEQALEKPAVSTGAKPSEPSQAQEGAQLPGGVRASPLARRMASDVGINLRDLDGSGPGGRIVMQDIKDYLSAPAKAAEKGAPIGAAPSAAPAVPAAGAPAKPEQPKIPLAPLPAMETPGDESIQISRLRSAVGRRMTESKQQVPHFYVTHEFDLEALMALRKQVNEMLPDDQKVSVNDFIIKAVAITLRQFPNLNAALKNDQIVHFGSINIGVAVAVENGLLTVVCRDADRKPLRQISAEVQGMVARARAGKVHTDDIEGSTFSISNLGMYDVENFSAIINPPEAGILAIGSARQIPVVKDGEVKIGWRMKTTISIDHRVSDGAEGARFLQALAPYLENPLRLLL